MSSLINIRMWIKSGKTVQKNGAEEKTLPAVASECQVTVEKKSNKLGILNFLMFQTLPLSLYRQNTDSAFLLTG